MCRLSPTLFPALRFSAAAAAAASPPHLLQPQQPQQPLLHLRSRHLRLLLLLALVLHFMGNVEAPVGLAQPPVLVALAKQPTSGTANACHKLEIQVLSKKDFSS
jgi:hypothetical protein